MFTDQGDGVKRKDWVRPVSNSVPVGKLDAHKLSKAHKEHGVQVDINPDKKTATVVQNVVEGMPAPDPKDGE